MTAFKVLTVEDDRIFSYSMFFRMEYNWEDWNYPKYKNSKLFVFKNIDDAMSFKDIQGSPCYKVFKVKVDSLKKVNCVARLHAEPQYISAFWRNFKKKQDLKRYADDYNLILAPEGSYLCNKLKIIGRI